MSAANIGRRLKKARLDAGLTQKDVATKLGITYQAISNYERGTNRVDTDTLSRLCEIYNIEIFNLLRTPLWDEAMFEAYHHAKTDSERQYYIQLWGCPAELIEAENNRREPETSPSLIPHSDQCFTSEEVALIRKYRCLDDRGKSAVLNVLNHEYESLPGEKAGASAKNA